MGRIIVVAVVVLVWAGCPSPNTYTTARTLPPGKVSVLAAVEGWGAGTEEGFFFVPTLPTLGIRAGLTDRVELGARLPNLLSAAADVKLNLLRGRIDVAIDPGVQWYQWRESSSNDSLLGSGSVIHAQLPVLVGFRSSPNATVVLMAGPSASTSTLGKSALLFGQLGVGADLRIFDSVSLFPQVAFIGGYEGGLFTAGLGFNFGSRPEPDVVASPAPR